LCLVICFFPHVNFELYKNYLDVKKNISNPTTTLTYAIKKTKKYFCHTHTIGAKLKSMCTSIPSKLVEVMIWWICRKSVIFLDDHKAGAIIIFEHNFDDSYNYYDPQYNISMFDSSTLREYENFGQGFWKL
jgi:hypothetical protein